MAYKERTRHVPSPLNLTRSPPPLLYDLPSEPTSSSSNQATFITSKSPRSPPRTPRGRPIGLLSPTGPNFTVNLNAGAKNTTAPSAYGLHHPQPLNGSQPAYGLPTPTRSASGTPTQEMDAFGALCRAWYVPPVLTWPSLVPFWRHLSLRCCCARCLCRGGKRRPPISPRDEGPDVSFGTGNTLSSCPV